MQAANNIIYPMIWQHIFIPFLPAALIDYLSAPIPFLIGVPEEVLKVINVKTKKKANSNVPYLNFRL